MAADSTAPAAEAPDEGPSVQFVIESVLLEGLGAEGLEVAINHESGDRIVYTVTGRREPVTITVE